MKGNAHHHKHPRAEHECHGGKAFKRGGKVEEEGHMDKDEAPSDVYAGAKSKVRKEADDKMDEFKRGGKARKKEVHHMEGHKGKHHAGRKPRKSGGKVLSSAAHGTMRPGFRG